MKCFNCGLEHQGSEIETLRARIAELEAMAGLARKARRLLRDYFCDGTSLHLAMIGWACEYDALAGQQQGGRADG